MAPIDGRRYSLNPAIDAPGRTASGLWQETLAENPIVTYKMICEAVVGP
jgi:hypothetical protein